MAVSPIRAFEKLQQAQSAAAVASQWLGNVGEDTDEMRQILSLIDEARNKLSNASLILERKLRS